MARYADLKAERDEALARAMEAERLSMKTEVDRIRAECAAEVARLKDAVFDVERIVTAAEALQAVIAEQGPGIERAFGTLTSALHARGKAHAAHRGPVWGISHSDDPEVGFQGAYPSREEAIVAGRGKYEGDFWIQAGEYPSELTEYFDVGVLLEDAEQAAYETLGAGEPTLDYSNGAIAELKFRVAAWVRDRVTSTVWESIGPPERIPYERPAFGTESAAE